MTSTTKPPFTSAMTTMRWLLPSAASGILLGMAFPPLDLSWLVWFGMVPLLWQLHRQPGTLRAFLAGLAGGTIFCFIILRPALSAHLWSGWHEDIDLESAEARQYQVLVLLWLLLSVWGGMFWAFFSALLSNLARGSLVRMALLAPPLFLVVAEWLRSLSSWDYHWAFLGNALIEVESLRQLGAHGGIWPLSWLAVLANVGVLAMLLNLRNASLVRWLLPAFIAGVLAVSVVLGSLQLRKTENLVEESPTIAVAALQYHKPEYYISDYIEIGMERQYVALLSQIMTGQAGEMDLLVLPESIALTAISLDGSSTKFLPSDMQFSIRDWAQVILGLMDLGDTQTSIVMGLNAVEGGKMHNSMLYWSPMGLAHYYHKQRLVPFAEYSPAALGMLGLRGESQYHRGTSSQPVLMNNIRFGTFICQEVLIPSVTREATRAGAQILISGGNDGVFADPAVAQIHARLAQFRAVENGRYVVRAMKTGVSAVISPTGEEMARSPGSEPHLVRGHAHPLDHQTLYTRFGDWPLLLAALILIGSICWSLYTRKLR